MSLARASLALGMLEPNSKLIKAAKAAAEAADAPVVGGVAVFLHGYRRTTEDVNLFAAEPTQVRDRLREAGAIWNAKRREFSCDGVPIHLVTSEQTGSPPEHVSLIQGVPVVGLPDLIRFKLHSGLKNLNRAKDLADVVELIRRVPLDKRFAAKLPRNQRAAFKRIVDSVHGDSRR
jgi:hypothetical protein